MRINSVSVFVKNNTFDKTIEKCTLFYRLYLF